MSELINLSLFLEGFKRHLRQILLITVVVGFAAAILTLLFYRNNYVSETMVYFDRMDSPAIQKKDYRTEIAQKVDVVDFNFFKSQLQILKSDLVYENLYERVKADSELFNHLKPKKPESLEKYLKTELLKETDIISLSAKAKSPEDAQKLSEYFAKTYQEVSTNTYLKPTLLKRDSLEAKIAEVQAKLTEKTAKLTEYEKQMGIIDAQQEQVDSVSHLEMLKKEEEDVASKIAASRAELNKLRSQVGLNTRSALNAVAVGQDDTYNAISSDLADAEREYQTQTATYTDNHPYMIRLKSRIDSLKAQLVKDTVLNTGTNTVNRVIRDNVRSSIIERTAKLESELQGLISQDIEKLKQIRQLSERSSSLPGKGLTVEQLKAEVDSLSDVLLQLQTSLEDVKLQLSFGKVYLYSHASLPDKPTFPSALQLPLVVMAAAFLLSSFFFGAQENFRHTQYCSLDALNETFGIPTLAMVPWVGSFEPSFVSMDLFNHVFNAFALRLKTEKIKSGHRAYILTSVQSQGSHHFTALKSLAASLGKTGDKVLIMETGLWPGTLRQEFYTQLDFSSSVPADVLLGESVSNLKKKITSNIYPLNINSNVYFLDLFTDQAVDSFALLSTPAFKQLVELLKSEFDWILCDAPSLIRHSDTYALISAFEAMILMVERDTPKANAYQAIQQVQNLGGYIAGVAVRNIRT